MAALTEKQAQTLSFLEASPDEVFTTRQIAEAIAGCELKAGQVSNWRRVMRALVKAGKARCVASGEWSLNGEAGEDGEESDTFFVTDGEAKGIMADALAAHFESVRKTDPERAARVAYVAGMNKMRLQVRKKVGPEEPKPEPARKKLPKRLTVTKFCAKAEAAYRAGAFSLDDAADATGLGRDYLRKIFQGGAVPRDETLEKIYAVVEEHVK